MNPADERLEALLDRWIGSLEAHLAYVELSDEEYFRRQPWPAHERPNRWVVELGLSGARDLRRQLTERRDAGDETFGCALELMGFLSTLLASQHLARVIPLVEAPAREAPAPAPVAVLEPTREMPRPAFVAARPAPRAAASDGSRTATEARVATVVADAIRLLRWGRGWHELASTIARMAGRPPIDEVRRILLIYKQQVDAGARRPPARPR